MTTIELGIESNPSAFAALKTNGTVVAWGNSNNGGSVPSDVELSDVNAIYPNSYAFAALKLDGSVVAWGNSGWGGSAPSGLSDVKAIASTSQAFAALKEDGTVVAWGNSGRGGTAPSGLSGVKTIYSNQFVFAALKTDGTVEAWGVGGYGGNVPSGLSGVKAIYDGVNSFAALKEDGTVEAWGHSSFGGSGVPSGLSGVKTIYSNYYAFAALKEDGSVEAWGQYSSSNGGPVGLSDVKAVYSNLAAFAALKEDGTVAAWGLSSYGGSGVPEGLSGVKAIYSTFYAFAALKEDGTVAAWGNSDNGGTGPSGLSGVKAIYSNKVAFAALKEDGTVVAWGGGFGVPEGLSGVKAIYSTERAFAALKDDGTVVAWGDADYGGIPTGDQLSQLTEVYTITYGKSYYRGQYLRSAVPNPTPLPPPPPPPPPPPTSIHFNPDMVFDMSLGLLKVVLYRATAWELSLDSGNTWETIDINTLHYYLSPGIYVKEQISIRSLLLPGNGNDYSDNVYNTEDIIIRPGKPRVVFNEDGKGEIRITGFNLPVSEVKLWAYSVNGGETWIEVREKLYNISLPPGNYTSKNLKVKAITEDGTSSSEPYVSPSLYFQVHPENPVVSVDDSNYTYTIEKLADFAVTWSYSIDGGKTWSHDYGLQQNYGLQQKKSFTLPAGKHQYGSIIIRNKTVDSVSDSPPLYMNKNYDIVKRPGVPRVSFEYRKRMIVSDLGAGAVKWRYSLNSGETWSEYLYQPLIVYLPTGTYVAGSIYVKSYTEDGTTHRNPEINSMYYISGIYLAGTYQKIDEQIISTVTVPFDKTQGEKLYDNEVQKINSIIGWPGYSYPTLIVNIEQSEYTSWEYSLGLNENDIRVWTKGEGTHTIIPPGYYTVYTIAIKVKKTDSETGQETSTIVFNLKDIVIYPKQPQVRYIEKGIFVIKLLDINSTWEYKIKNSEKWEKGYGSTFLVKPDTYNIGDIWVRSVLNNEVMSPYTSNTVPITVLDNDYHVNDLPEKDWEITTILKTPAYKHDTVLNVYSNNRFAVKKAVIIGYGEKSETRIVTGFGSLLIDRPLKNNYPEGTLVRGFDIELIDSLSLAERAYGLVYAGSKLRSSSNRVKCMKYIFDPENATIDTCTVPNESKELLGDGIGTKTNKINNIVKSGKGKIVYGENGLSSPFLPPDTIEDTPVSIFYRCNVPNDVPIINGLRGGIVPLKMRTNKF